MNIDTSGMHGSSTRITGPFHSASPHESNFLRYTERLPVCGGIDLRWHDEHPLEGFHVWLCEGVRALESHRRIALTFALGQKGWPTHLRSMETAERMIIPGSPWTDDDDRALAVLMHFGLAAHIIAAIFFEGRMADECVERMAYVRFTKARYLDMDSVKKEYEEVMALPAPVLSPAYSPVVHTPMMMKNEGSPSGSDTGPSPKGSKLTHQTSPQTPGFNSPSTPISIPAIYIPKTPQTPNFAPSTSQKGNKSTPRKAPYTPNSTSNSTATPNSTPNSKEAQNLEAAIQTVRNNAIESCKRYLTEEQQLELEEALRLTSDWPHCFASINAYNAAHQHSGSLWTEQDTKALMKIRSISNKLPYPVIAENFFPARSANAIRHRHTQVEKIESGKLVEKKGDRKGRVKKGEPVGDV
ncbi:hypothetical protein P280DRAFT_512423 [Massarina eburnea CBS 473.64]|uniref:Uncharacterized protein n=1 Tax=Massarina eburnea CBS 473.64 TaxID=1395130 RepID=A0A6A6SHR3_9PLEO|nr:hypothetical protein P280DRAFT_512423 [Massarina eburnea CBS 473.64]